MSSIQDKWNPELLKSLGRLDFIAREVLDGVKQGMHRSVRRGFSTEFFDYKSYQHGDDAQKIDWRLYAKTRKFYVKRFEAETSLECIMVLDTSRSMSWQWEDAVSKHEYCTALAASIGMLFIEQRDHVGLLTFGEGNSRFLPPKSSMKQLNHLFGILAQEPENHKEVSFLHAVHELRSLQRHRGLVIVFSDLELPEDDVLDALKLLSSHGDEVLIFHILDIAEIQLPFESATHLQDSESGHLYPVNMSALKSNHDRRIQEFRARFQMECRSNHIVYVPIDTSMSYVQAIMKMDQARKEML